MNIVELRLQVRNPTIAVFSRVKLESFQGCDSVRKKKNDLFHNVFIIYYYKIINIGGGLYTFLWIIKELVHIHNQTTCFSVLV